MLSRFPVIASSLMVLLSKIKQPESCLYQHEMAKFLLNIPSIPQWSALQVFVWSGGLNFNIGRYEPAAVSGIRLSPLQGALRCWLQRWFWCCSVWGYTCEGHCQLGCYQVYRTRCEKGSWLSLRERLPLSIQSDWASSFTNVLRTVCMVCQNQGSFNVR